CAAKLGMVSLTLTPLAPWHATQTVSASCFPASTSAAYAGGTAAIKRKNPSAAFMAVLPWCFDSEVDAGIVAAGIPGYAKPIAYGFMAMAQTQANTVALMQGCPSHLERKFATL